MNCEVRDYSCSRSPLCKADENKIINLSRLSLLKLCSSHKVDHEWWICFISSEGGSKMLLTLDSLGNRRTLQCLYQSSWKHMYFSFPLSFSRYRLLNLERWNLINAISSGWLSTRTSKIDCSGSHNDVLSFCTMSRVLPTVVGSGN